ncbi:MAG: hypothetical protein AAFZ65_17195 [Planctomycetota bacterium]
MSFSIIRRLRDDVLPPEDAHCLPGFEENGVTYESHTFWLAVGRHGYRSGPDGTLFVRHGAGRQSLALRHMATAALLALIEGGRRREAFFLAWELFDQIRRAEDHAWAQFRQAVVDGRVRKTRARGGTHTRPLYRVEILSEDRTTIHL